MSNDGMKVLLKRFNLGVTESELHGFLTGLLVGHASDKSWGLLLRDFIGEGEAFSAEFEVKVVQFHADISAEINSEDMIFQPLLADNSFNDRARDLVGWINHLLLGLGLAYPQFVKHRGEIAEAVADLQEISRLDYNDQLDPAEVLAQSLEEVIEYVRVVTLLFYEEFAKKQGKGESAMLH